MKNKDLARFTIRNVSMEDLALIQKLLQAEFKVHILGHYLTLQRKDINK